ncbi:MAG: response regulator [Halolamina sp.]
MAGETLLYVDDDAALRDLVTTQLRQRTSDLDVETESDPTVVADDPGRLADVVCLVTDYEMPRMDGIELLERVRERDTELPVILYTGHGSETVASDAISSDATDYIRKGSGGDHYELLANRVRSAVDHYRATRRADRTDRRRLRVLQRITDRFLAIDRDWKVTEINDKAAASFGRSREELLGQPFLEIAEKRIGARSNPFVETYREAMETQEPKTFVGKSDSEAGTWLEVRAYPSEDGLSVFARDVTDRKRREHRLRQLHEATTRLESCETHEAVLETGVEMASQVLDLDMCVFSLAKDGLLVPAATSEKVPEDGVGKFSDDEGIVGETFQTGDGFLIDDLADHTEAEPKDDYAAIISLPMEDRGTFQAVSNEVGAFDETDYELTRLLVDHVASALDRVDRTDRLRRQNDLLDDFASMVSHDLKSGLTAVGGRIDLAAEAGTTTAVTEQLAAAEESLDRLQSQVEDMLEFARRGKPVTDTAFVDLDARASEAWRGVGTDGATLRSTADCRVEADPDRLHQLLENLFANAVEHGGPSVTVEVGVTDAGFYVADDGPGIDSGEESIVLERGYTTADSGTGYGLSIVAEIANAHGWAVEVGRSAAGGARIDVTDVDAIR